jgi:hypothetical protein
VALETDDVGVVDVGVTAGLPSEANDSFRAAAAVAVQSRVLPSTGFLPIPPWAINPSV